MVETVYICSGMCKVQIILEEAGLAGRRGEGVDAGASGRYSLIVGCSGAHVPPTSRYLVSPRGRDDNERYFRPQPPAAFMTVERTRETANSRNGSAV